MIAGTMHGVNNIKPEDKYFNSATIISIKTVTAMLRVSLDGKKCLRVTCYKRQVI
jgi:hypothetical protein